MPKTYSYTARDRSGNLYRGKMDADRALDVVRYLRKEGFFTTSVEELKAKRHFLDITYYSDILRYPPVTAKDLSVFCRQFAVMLEAGVPVVGALKILETQLDHRRLVKGIKGVRQSVESGRTLADSMQDYSDVFPEMLVHVVEAGEVSGSLDAVLNRLSAHYERESNTRQKIRSATTYPIVVLVLAVIMIVFMSTFVLPQFLLIFQGMNVEMPGITKALIKAIELSRRFWYLFLIVPILLICLAYMYSKTEKGRQRADVMWLRVPVIGGIMKNVITVRFCRTLAGMISSGLPIMDALDIVERAVNNHVIGEAIHAAKKGVREGSGLSGPLGETGVFAPMVIQMLSVGEETGKIDVVLDKIADFYDVEVETSVERATKLIEPVILISLALGIALILGAVMLPLFRLIRGI